MTKNRLKLGDIVRLTPCRHWLPVVMPLVGQPLIVRGFSKVKINGRVERRVNLSPLGTDKLLCVDYPNSQENPFNFSRADMILDTFITEVRKARRSA